MITGANSQLGKQFTEDLNVSDYQVYALSRGNMDITDFSGVDKNLRKIKPDIVIHCAAYTKVDLAEVESMTCKDCYAFLCNT